MIQSTDFIHISCTYLCMCIQAMVFPVVMYGCESWTIKKAKQQRIDTFKLWCWRRLLIVPWTARRSNQWIRKEISPEYSFEGLTLKLKLQYFDHLMWRANTLEKTGHIGKDPEAGKDQGRDIKRMTEHEIVGWHHQPNGLESEQTGRQLRTGTPSMLQSTGSQSVRQD